MSYVNPVDPDNFTELTEVESDRAAALVAAVNEDSIALVRGKLLGGDVGVIAGMKETPGGRLVAPIAILLTDEQALSLTLPIATEALDRKTPEGEARYRELTEDT